MFDVDHFYPRFVINFEFKKEKKKSLNIKKAITIEVKVH